MYHYSVNLQDDLKTCHSLYASKIHNENLNPKASWSSYNMNVCEFSNVEKLPHLRIPQDAPNLHLQNENCAEYYKRYEHDDLPVKDDAESKSIVIKGKASLTNSDLDKLENKIYKNISQDLQNGPCSVSSLEPNIKLFKTTVQEIFDKFYKSMQDFELYKKRFDEILSKDRADSIGDMKNFITDMIHHIMSTDSNSSYVTRNSAERPNLDVDTFTTCEVPDREAVKLLESLHSLVESYKNENYLTDSTYEDTPSKIIDSTKKEFNIISSNNVPFRKIKLNNRNLLSEITIKDRYLQQENHVASAENIKKLAAKKEALDKYMNEHKETHKSDTEIPVKAFFAKMNIHFNEDLAQEKDKDYRKSLMSKICSYICKKFRKI